MGRAFDIIRTQSRQSSPPVKRSATGSGGRNSQTFILGLIVILAALALTGSLFQGTKKSEKSSETQIFPEIEVEKIRGNEPKNNQSPAPQSSPAETQAPQPSFNKADLKIEILNGSGAPGAATNAKEKLEADGFKVAKIGNAKNKYAKTTIYFKNNLEAGQAVGKVLEKDNFEKSAITGIYDILVVVGKD